MRADFHTEQSDLKPHTLVRRIHTILLYYYTLSNILNFYRQAAHTYLVNITKMDSLCSAQVMNETSN